MSKYVSRCDTVSVEKPVWLELWFESQVLNYGVVVFTIICYKCTLSNYQVKMSVQRGVET